MKMDLDQYLRELEILVNTDSGQGNCEGITEVGDFFADRFAAMGWIVEKYDLRPHTGNCTVVKNRSIDLLRRTASIPVGDTEDVEAMSGDNTPAPIEYLLSREGYEHLLGYIDELGDTYRSVCRLKYVNGLREAEIADLLNLSPKTVSVRLFRARRILKNKIREGHHVPEDYRRGVVGCHPEASLHRGCGAGRCRN